MMSGQDTLLGDYLQPGRLALSHLSWELRDENVYFLVDRWATEEEKRNVFFSPDSYRGLSCEMNKL